MNCPNCDAPNLRTVETFQQPEKTYRTKKCRGCQWTFTSHETLADVVAIPKVVRMANRSRAGAGELGRQARGPVTRNHQY